MSDPLTNPENVTMSAGHDDGITATASPRPWRVSDRLLDRYSTDHRDIVDAKGEFVAVRVSSADSALIVDAVNEREAVREALRDMEADAEAAWEGTPLRRVLVKHVTALREALAAALDHANECSRRAAAERAGRARAVEEAQRDANMEADRLRDIVRRMIDCFGGCYHVAKLPAGGAFSLLAEARAAIGEDKQ